MTYDQDTISKQAVLDLLRQEIEQNHESQAAFARSIGVPKQYISQVLKQQRPPSEAMLRTIGVEEITIYRRTAEPV